MAVPNIFANVTTTIPLSQLDANFATAITLGNTAVYLGNTTTTLGNVTLTGVTVSSGNVTVTNATATNATVTTLTSPAATALTVQSAGTTAMTIDTSQNVGIGTTTPASDTANERILQVNAPTTFATVSLSTSRSNASGDNIGKLSFDVLNNTATYRSRAQIVAQSTGSTANKYGANMLFYTASDNTTDATERMRIDSSGKWYLNTTSSNYNACGNFNFNGFGNGLDTKWAGTASIYHLLCTNGNGLIGGIQTSGSTTAFVTSSDYRLKENIMPMTGALVKVLQLKPVTYKWKADGSDGQGFIAHELQEVVPDCVAGEKDAVNEDGSIKPQSVDTSFLVATLVASIQELKAIVDAQATEIAQLKAKVGA